MIALTKGIVLNRLKYGDSSLIVPIFTKQFGLQSCILKGLGKNKKNNNEGNLLFPASIVELSMYYQEEKNIKLIKEVHAGCLHQTIIENIPKNCIATFAMEVLKNLLTADFVQEDLFEFCCEFLQRLDASEEKDVANYPIFFLIQAGKTMGYQILGEYTEKTPLLDLPNGRFISSRNKAGTAIPQEIALLMSRLNAADEITTVQQIKINRAMRKAVLEQFQLFLHLHLPRFKPLKSIAVLSEILS